MNNSATSGIQYIPLTLAEGPVATGVPLHTGIPFPISAITSLANLRLESGDGSQEIPAQFDALSRWPDGTIKSALVNFVADLGSARTYRIAYGASVTRAALPRAIAVTGNPASEVMVDTGLVRFAINNKGIMNKLWRDSNANGAFESNEQIIDGGDMFMVNAFDNLEYTASSATDTKVTIEENGPLRAVIKAQGSLANGSTKLIKYLIRYYASQGSDKVDIEATIIDDRLEAHVDVYPTTLAIAGKSLGLRWHYLSDGDGTTAYRLGGEGGAAYGGTVTAEHFILQTGQFNYVDGNDQGHTFAYSGAGSGEKAPGWVSLDSGDRHLALMVKDFWQQFPCELNIDGNNITAALFPARSIAGAAITSLITPSGTTYQRPNTLYFVRPGGAKTYYLRFALGSTAPATSELTNLNNSYQRHRLDLMAPISWYTASSVFGDLNVGGSTATDTGFDASLMRDIYEPSIDQGSGGQGGNATMFGWRDFGDRLRAGWANVVNGQRIPSFYNDTHVGANNFIKEFLRTGDQRWYGLGEISTRHFMDIDVSHGPRQGYWRTGGLAQPAGELKGMAHDTIDHEDRNLHKGHAHVSGLSDLYLLTGDKRSYDVLSEIGNWWRFVSPYFFKLPFAATVYREAERDFAWPLYVMNEYVRVTGDAQYHKDVSTNLVSYLIQWWQTPLNHIGYDPTTGIVSNNVLGVNNAVNGTGYWTMTRMDNYGAANLSTGTNPWMAGPLFSNIIKFYEQDMLFNGVGKSSAVNYAQIKDMLFQCMNYIVKYGYENDKKYFVYSEVVRGYSGGDSHIIYPLAYLDRLYNQELVAGRIANPGWYDTRSQWGIIAKQRYNNLLNMKARAYTQSYGFYGYEIVYPLDFFKVMQDSLASPATSNNTKAKIYLGADDSFTVSNSGTIIYGGAANDTVTIATEVTGVSLDQNIKQIILPYSSTSYTFKQTGNKINVYDVSGATLIVTVPVQGGSDGTILFFSNGKTSALLSGGVMTLGGVTVNSTKATILNPATSTATISPASSTKAKVYLGSGDDSFIINNSGTTLYGGDGNDSVTLSAGVIGVILDQNVEQIRLSKLSGSYAFKQTGNQINIYDPNSNALIVSAPVQVDSDGTVLGFSDGSASALLSGGVMTLGGATVSAAAPTTLNPILKSLP